MPTNIQPPKQKRRGVVGEPPSRVETKENLEIPDPGKVIPMQFAVPAEFKREYKVAAANRNLKMVEVLRQSFELWKEKYG